LALGIGNDIVEIDRIRRSIARHGQHFLNRIFTQKEQDYCYKFQDPAPHFSVRFSIKEAIAKALGTGLGEHLGWQDIEILNDELGKPIVLFSAKAKKRFNDPQFFISLSHSETHATSVALWNK
jgi:holo-[acyl-carrier protein] synthase